MGRVSARQAPARSRLVRTAAVGVRALARCFGDEPRLWRRKGVRLWPPARSLRRGQGSRHCRLPRGLLRAGRIPHDYPRIRGLYWNSAFDALRREWPIVEERASATIAAAQERGLPMVAAVGRTMQGAVWSRPEMARAGQLEDDGGQLLGQLSRPHQPSLPHQWPA
jgi:hypothetical protein